jgi:hypothetical protein
MSNDRGGSSKLLQILGAYVAASWVCLQVVDLLIQNLSLPSWVFVMTLLILGTGFPITAATAYLQGRRREEGTAQGPVQVQDQLLTWQNLSRWGIGAMALWGVAVTGWLLLGRSTMSEGEVFAEVEAIEALVAAADFTAAYQRVAGLEGEIRDDTLRSKLWAEVAGPLEIRTEPEGAAVFRRAYGTPDAQWEELGRTPVTVERFPRGISRLRFEAEGRRMRELAGPLSSLQELEVISLDPENALPDDMVRVSGRSGGSGYGLFVPGLEQAPKVDLGEFLMSAHEVTNAKYASFMADGGYTQSPCWPEQFLDGDEVLTFDEGIARFTDGTGRPGPSTWDAGSYLPGTENHPVGGVSWYEASAYACWAGAELPTVYHWYAAANPFSSPHVVPMSNYGGAVAAVGSYEGVSSDGVYDLAGNVREWVQNATSAQGGDQFILGGGWSDLEYSFNDAVTAPSFDRSKLNGIRLVKTLDTTNLVAASQPIEMAFRDYRAEVPVSDEVFEVFRQAYAYDPAPLNAEVVAVDTTDTFTRERIELDAGYGGERLTVLVFLPPGGTPPYRPIVYFPGSNAIYAGSSLDLEPGVTDFILRSGRALIFPIYKGTFERRSELRTDIQDESNLWRDHMLAWSTDFRRSLDYVETREEFDMDKLGYMGISWGGAVAPVMLALEDRVKASVLIVGGLLMQTAQPMADPFHFLPRVRQPTLMINARWDSFYPLETAGRPLFDNLGAPEDQKKLVIIDASHGVFSYDRNRVVAESLEWLDTYLQ